MPNTFRVGGNLGEGITYSDLCKKTHIIGFQESYNNVQVNALSNCGLFELGYLKVAKKCGALEDVTKNLAMTYDQGWSNVVGEEIIFSRIATVTEEQDTLKSALLDLGWKEAGDFYNPNSGLTCTLMTYLKNKEDFKKEGVY